MIKCIFEDGGETLLRHVAADTLVLNGDKILLSELPDEEEMAFDHYGAIKLYLKYKNGEISIPVLE